MSQASTSEPATTGEVDVKDAGTTVSPAVVYDRALKKVVKDIKVLLLKSDRTSDITMTLVQSMFEVMRTWSLEVDNANPDAVIHATEDVMMTYDKKDKTPKVDKPAYR